MSAAQQSPTPGQRKFDPQARELVHRLVRLFGIERTRKLLWESISYLKHEFGEDSE